MLDSDATNATQYLLKSYGCYKVWGATEKMKHLTKTYPTYLNDENINNSKLNSSSIHSFEVKSQASISQVTNDIFSTISVDAHRNKRVRFDKQVQTHK